MGRPGALREVELLYELNLGQLFLKKSEAKLELQLVGLYEILSKTKNCQLQSLA